MNETHVSVTSHSWLSHVMFMNGSRHIRSRMSQVTSAEDVADVSCLPLACVRRESFICATWLIRMWDLTHSYVRHGSFIEVSADAPYLRLLLSCLAWLTCVSRDPFICATWPICKFDMTHSYVRRDSLMCATWLIAWLWHVWAMTHLHVQHDPFICATWLIHKCDVTCSYVRRDSFTCATWLIHWGRCWRVLLDADMCEPWLIYMCNMTHLYVQHDSFICATRLIYMCDVTHSYVQHDLFSGIGADVFCFTLTCVWRDSFMCVTRLIHVRDMTHSYVWHDSGIWSHI